MARLAAMRAKAESGEVVVSDSSPTRNKDAPRGRYAGVPPPPVPAPPMAVVAASPPTTTRAVELRAVTAAQVIVPFLGDDDDYESEDAGDSSDGSDDERDDATARSRSNRSSPANSARHDEDAPKRANWIGHATRRRLFAVNAFTGATARQEVRPEMAKQGSLVSTSI
jgi:hypothetical protein